MFNLALLSDYENNNVLATAQKIADLCANQAAVNLLLAGNRASEQLVEAAYTAQSTYGKFTITWFATQTGMLKEAAAVLAFHNGSNKYTRYGLNDAKRAGVAAQRVTAYQIDQTAIKAFKTARVVQIVADNKRAYELKLGRMDAYYSFSLAPMEADTHGDENSVSELLENLLLNSKFEANAPTWQAVKIPGAGFSFRLPVGELVGTKTINVWRVQSGAVVCVPVVSPVVRVKRPARAAGSWTAAGGLEYDDQGLVSAYPNGVAKPSRVVAKQIEKELGIESLPVPKNYQGLQCLTVHRSVNVGKAQGVTTTKTIVHRGRIVARSVEDHTAFDFLDLAEDPRGFERLGFIDDAGHIDHDQRATSSILGYLPTIREEWLNEAQAMTNHPVNVGLFAEGCDQASAAVVSSMNYDKTDARPQLAYDRGAAIARTIARLRARYAEFLQDDFKLAAPSFRGWLRRLLRDADLHTETQDHVVEFLTA